MFTISAVVAEALDRGRVALVGLQPPDEPGRVVGAGVDRVQRGDEVAQQRRVERLAREGDVDLGEVDAAYTLRDRRPATTSERCPLSSTVQARLADDRRHVLGRLGRLARGEQDAGDVAARGLDHVRRRSCRRRTRARRRPSPSSASRRRRSCRSAGRRSGRQSGSARRSGSRHSAGSEGIRGSVAPIDKPVGRDAVGRPHEAPQRAGDQDVLARQRAEAEVLVEHAGVDLVRRRGRSRSAASGCAAPRPPARAETSRYFSARGKRQPRQHVQQPLPGLRQPVERQRREVHRRALRRRGLPLGGRQEDQHLSRCWTSEPSWDQRVWKEPSLSTRR